MVSKFELFAVLEEVEVKYVLTARQIAARLNKPLSQVRRALRRNEHGFKDKDAQWPLVKKASGTNVIGWTLLRPVKL